MDCSDLHRDELYCVYFVLKPTMNSTKSTVLVVDDEKDIRDICQGIIMRSFECSVLAKESIESARHTIESEHIDLAILDIHLQDGIGFELIPLLRAQYPDVKIIMISAYNQCSEMEKAKELNVSQFLGKPFTAKELKNTLYNWL